MVLYLVCFDLSAESNKQREQIFYWLQFLNSSVSNIPHFHTSNSNNRNWRVLVVGLKSDIEHASSTFTTEHLRKWQFQVKNLPLFDKQLFKVSSCHSTESVQKLLQSITSVCSEIFDQHTILIPSSFQKLWKSIKSLNSQKSLQPSTHSQSHPINTLLMDFSQLHQQLGNECGIIDLASFKHALNYLHTIGNIVFLHNGKVCASPDIIPKLLAKFICPSEVQDSLLSQNPNVQIVTQKDVGCVLMAYDDQR